MEAVLGLEILLPVAAVVVVHIIQVPLVQVQRVKVTMAEMALVHSPVLAAAAALVPSVETALVLAVQV